MSLWNIPVALFLVMMIVVFVGLFVVGLVINSKGLSISSEMHNYLSDPGNNWIMLVVLGVAAVGGSMLMYEELMENAHKI